MKYLALLLALAACEPVTNASMNLVDGIPSQSGCVPGTQACVPTDAGVYPAACSGRSRLWPILPRHDDGSLTLCLPTQVCLINDAGRAVCQ